MNVFCRVLFAGAILFVLTASAFALSNKATYGQAFNIILISYDALRADHLGCYGYRRQTSPFIDALAQNAVIFDRCVAQAGTTVPALAALFTSKFPYLDGVVSAKQFSLGKNFVTLAEFLRKQGYLTIGIPGNYYAKKIFGFDRGFDYFDDTFLKYRNADDFVERARVAMGKRKNSYKPVFLWMHIREPHSPYNSPENYQALFRERKPGSREKNWYKTLEGMQSFSNAELALNRDAYDANIRFADDKTKEIFHYLEQEGMLKNTLVIVTADHGEAFGEYRFVGHNAVYFPIIHIPLIIKMPDGATGRNSTEVSAVDIFPTIADLVCGPGASSEYNFRGQNFFTGPAGRQQYSENVYYNQPALYSLVQRDFQLICASGAQETKLFQVFNQSASQTDCKHRFPQEHQQLREGIQQIWEQAENPRVLKLQAPMYTNEEEKSALKALGYIN